jgi:glycosyltransferase involved in cell wall biosynthesis
MTPLVSILIPAYNAAEWLHDTLESAVAQTWKRREIIVVDDGSRDQTLAVARRFESAEVKVHSQANQGAAAARNRALELSQGDYIQWLDADDLLSPNKVEAQVDLLRRTGTEKTLASGPWGQFLYRASRARFEPSLLWEDLAPTEWLVRKMANNLHMQTGTWLVSRQVTQAAGPWNTRLLGDDDGEYFCRILLNSDGVRFAPEAKVYYRMAGTSSLSYIGRSNKKLEAQYRSMQLHIDYLRSLEDSERTRRAAVAYLHNWIGNFYPERADIIAEAEQLAASLGGELRVPALSWKYRWIETTLGAAAAKRAKVFLPGVKWWAIRQWDRALSKLERPALKQTT